MLRVLAIVLSCLALADAWTSGLAPSRAPAGSRAAVVAMADRTPLMAGNWKMNTELSEAVSLASAVSDEAKKAKDVDVAVCVPYPFLCPVGDALKGGPVSLGAQDAYYEESGAYTGAPPHPHLHPHPRPHARTLAVAPLRPAAVGPRRRPAATLRPYSPCLPAHLPLSLPAPAPCLRLSPPNPTPTLAGSCGLDGHAQVGRHAVRALGPLGAPRDLRR